MPKSKRNKAIERVQTQSQRAISSFSNEELFTELMRRVVQMDSRVCYFVDTTHRGVWNLHAASGGTMIESL